MTKIIQADRDAAAEAFFCKPLLNEKHNDDRRVRAFARHRLEERAKIVAWLRKEDKSKEMLLFNQIAWVLADNIEAGEYEAFTRSGDT